MVRRRMQQSSLSDVLLKDLRLIGWGLGLAVLGSALVSLREAIWVETSLSYLDLWLLNGLAALGFVSPLFIFLLAVNCLRPGARFSLRRSGAVLLLAIYLAMVFLAGQEPAGQSFFWSGNADLWASRLESAFASALLLGSFFVVAYRFVASSGGTVGVLFRLSLLGGLGWFVASWQGFNEGALAPEPSDRTPEFIFVIDDLEFSAANDFLTLDASSSLRSMAREFRPLSMTGDDPAGQWATLMLGILPFEHGLRLATEGHTWPLVRQALREQMGRLAEQRGLHWTNVMHPSATLDLIDEVVPADIPGTRCHTMDADTSGNFDARLQKIKTWIAPLYPWSLARKLDPRIACSSFFGVAADDIIHEELFGPWSQSLQSHPARTVSIWSLDLAAISVDGPSGETGGLESSPVRTSFGRLLNVIMGNFDILGFSRGAIVHVVGLSRNVESPGAYLKLQTGQSRPEQWPLPDENVLLGLGELGRRFSSFVESPDEPMFTEGPESAGQAKNDSHEIFQGLVYREWSENSGALPVRTAALRVSRQLECAVSLGPDTLPANLRVFLPELTKRESWEIIPSAKLLAGQPESFERCSEKMKKALEWLVREDIGLLEPYERDWSEADPVALLGSEKGSL